MKDFFLRNYRSVDGTKNYLAEEVGIYQSSYSSQVIQRHPAILCVDDEPSILESLKMILEIKDYEVHTALDGYSALNLIDQNKGHYDVIITGYKMPGMDGIELLRKIKSKYPDIPIAIVSAYYTELFRQTVINSGGFMYLRKPFLMEEIYDLVNKGIKLREEAKNKNAKST